MWCAKLVLIFYLGLVHCRPQNQQPTHTEAKVDGSTKISVDENSNVEIQRQLVEEVKSTDADQRFSLAINPFSHRKIEASTREILEKIAEVNKNQGLIHKKPRPNFFHFPFSYSRSQENVDKSTNFKISKNPFTNPVLAYLENESENNMNKNNNPAFRESNYNTDVDIPDNYVISMTNPNAEVEPEDHIPGQYIKRKITHYQGFLMPNPYMLNQYNFAPSNPPPSDGSTRNAAIIPPPIYSASQQPNNLYQFPSQQLGYSMYPIHNTVGMSEGVFGSGKNKNLTGLEKTTVEHIKNIVTGSNQNYQNRNNPPYFPTPYYSNLPIGYEQFLRGNTQEQQNLNPNLHNVPYINSNMVQSDVLAQNGPQTRTENFNIPNLPINYGMATLRQPSKARQNWNWPGANLFPIYIRDPFLQMYYAVTNMIEYGPNSGNEGPCKLTPRPQGTRIKINTKTSANLEDKAHQIHHGVNKITGAENVKVFKLDGSNLADNTQYLDVEDIDIGDDELVKFTINVPEASSFEARGLTDHTKSEKTMWDKLNQVRNDSALFQITSGKLDFSSHSISTEPPLLSGQLTSIRDQIVHSEDIEDEIESEKADDISISNQGTKKVFSRENTGSGIFIHKLKVRQGGVAIAGPGGIATAGSGGTAIVGPNGIAYTHPDGLAIAGSGTKVIAVDPDIDLNDVIKDSVLNGTRHVPNTRVGKIVAVGPVVYYNRG